MINESEAFTRSYELTTGKLIQFRGQIKLCWLVFTLQRQRAMAHVAGEVPAARD